VRAAIVERESAVLPEFNIGGQQIMMQYWTLATPPAADTNGQHYRPGQSPRLAMRYAGLRVAAAGAGIPPEKAPDVYRAAWMRKADGEAEEEDDMGPVRGTEEPPPQEPKTDSPEN
jgi:hypothetical protein